MKTPIIAGVIKPPHKVKQQRLHHQLGVFARWMQRPKDASEIQKDTLKAVPVAQLPMVF